MKQTIIYDDTTPATKRFAKWYENNFNYALANSPKEYSWGMNRHVVANVKRTLNSMLRRTKFNITNNVEHAHGIGNNNAFDVAYNDGEKEIIIAKIAINDDMYGGILSYVTDLEGHKISKKPKVPVAKKATTNIYKAMWWNGQKNIVVHRHGNFWKGFGSTDEFLSYIKQNGGTIEKSGDLQVARTGCLIQEYKVTMKEVLNYK